MEPGLYALSDTVYHSDPCSAPSLSASIIKIMLDKSLAHAREAHPKLRQYDPPEHEPKYDFGTAVHAYVLEQGAGVKVINPEDYPAKNGNVPNGWTNDAIRAARAEAIEDGLTPVLPKEWKPVQEAGEAIRANIAANPDTSALLDKPITEHTLIWQEDNGVWCRAKVDLATRDWSLIGDLKTSGMVQTPESINRQYAPNMGWVIQDAFYTRGVKVLGLHDNPRFRFILGEIVAPYVCSSYGFMDDDLAIANQAIDWAIAEWKKCLDTSKWPGYSAQTMTLQMPPWYVAKLLGRGEPYGL